MFINSNYSAKLSPTMTENWLVQIFKNTNASVAYTDTPDLRFSLSETVYDGENYYPAILNKPSVSYSLDLKGFTTKTGSVTLNIANINLDGTTLLELLGDEYINGQVNILSQIDHDNTAANALQIFSGKISSFSYRANTIVLSVVSNRPFQNVSIPQGKTESTTDQYNNKVIPLVYGDYEPNTNFVNGTDVYACPFLKNDGKNFIYIIPEGTNSADKLEFYDKGMKRFIELTDTNTTLLNEALDSSETGVDVDDGTKFKINDVIKIDSEQMLITSISTNTLTVTRAYNSTSATTHLNNAGITVVVDKAETVSVPKNMKRVFKVLPDAIPNGVVKQEGSGSGVIAVTGDIENSFDGSTDTEVDVNHATNFSGVRGFTMKLEIPQVTGKITAITLGLDGTLTQAYSSGSPGVDDGLFVSLATELSGGFGSTTPSKHTAIIGASNNYSRTTSIDLTASHSAVDISGLLENGALPDDLYLSFRWDTADGDVDCNSWNVSLENVYVTVTAENDLTNEPIASQEFNAGIDKVYLGRDILTEGFTAYSSPSTLTDLDNPVAIHRQLLHSILNVADSNSDAKIENSGYKAVAELRDSTLTSPTSTHWKTRLQLDEPEALEGIMKKLQYEGCFFFEFSPQANQSAISGVSPLRYFTIEDSVTANVDLSQNDISGYEIGVTDVQSLETRVLVNYKKHPAENQYLKQYDYPATFSGSAHETIFGDEDIQKQEVSLDFLYDAVDKVAGSRNSSWLNFRESLFGDYKTTVNATLVNPEKYAMLQVGDAIDFGEITYEELASPFDEISETFDDFIAMPSRLFSESWSGKKFLITNLKRTLGKITIQTRQVI